MFFALLLTLFLLKTTPILASDNIFGLHLTQTSDINSAAPLINSTGGDWGWATIVIRVDQLDSNTWQNFFDICRRQHITPILRLATTIKTDGTWNRPQKPDINKLADFLNSLNWPQQKQHITLFNEINHASEWGGGVDIKNFTDISLYTAQKFKTLNPNFYILTTGLDLASPDNPPQYLSAPTVYRQIISHQPQYFDHIDALASHSYPNHGFVGRPSDTGRHSISGYQWELNFLRSLGIQKTLPVFITETGWPHRQGHANNDSFYTNTTASNFFKTALQIWAQDPRIQAVTPFIYNYPNPPFDHFSWLDSNENLYPDYQQIINLPKKPNSVQQVTDYQNVKIHLPFIIFSNKQYSGKIILKNTGQSIWGPNETQFCLDPQTTPNILLSPICTSSSTIEPQQTHTFDFQFQIVSSPNHSGKSFLSWQNLPPFEITPITTRATIYRPKTGLWQTIQSFFQKVSPYHTSQ